MNVIYIDTIIPCEYFINVFSCYIFINTKGNLIINKNYTLSVVCVELSPIVLSLLLFSALGV